VCEREREREREKEKETEKERERERERERKRERERERAANLDATFANKTPAADASSVWCLARGPKKN
jgi:hypothetical protein